MQTEKKRTKTDLIQMQSLPLEVKILMTQRRIREWVSEFGVDGVYVSFSGGKDSTVLLHLVRDLYPDVEAVFVNTGLEYIEIQSFAKSFDNVTVYYPEMSFKEVIQKYGYPFISKSVSHNIAIARNTPNGKIAQNYVFNKNSSKFSAYKYRELTKTDFKITDRCCDIMKKRPFKKFGKGEKYPFIATLTEESELRKKSWLKSGCNAFDDDMPSSRPMSFWTEQDVLRYIKLNDIKIASVYGDVAADKNGQTAFDDCGCDLCLTGCNRTGCIFCGFGAHLEKGEGRFERLKRTHPKQYDFCMNGGSYDSDGIWKPDKNGLGMKHVIDELNRLYSKKGEKFIKY